MDTGSHNRQSPTAIADARPAGCQICEAVAVCEIRADGSWLVRCPHCGTVQFGLPGFPPPPISPDAIALGLDLQ
ncbi:MAG: hypothetical protein ACREN1_07635 [Candidatus Dormibacteria bacterium]